MDDSCPENLYMHGTSKPIPAARLRCFPVTLHTALFTLFVKNDDIYGGI